MSLANLEILPASGKPIDLEISAGTQAPGTWSDVRNMFWADDGCAYVRPGLRSDHLPITNALTPYGVTTPTNAPVQGLHYFRPTYNTGQEGHLILVAFNGYLLASALGRDIDLVLARNLGGEVDVPYFAEFYHDDERCRYLLVGSTHPKFPISYWRAHDVRRLADPSVHVFSELRPVPGLSPEYQFCVQHNNRMFYFGRGTEITYSAAGDFRDLVNGDRFALDPRFGTITAAFPSFYGELIVGQENALQRLAFDGGGDIADAKPLTTELGVMSHRAIASLGNDKVFVDDSGQLSTLAAVNAFGDIQTRKLSSPLYRRFKTPVREGWSHIWMANDRHRGVLWIGHGKSGALRNDALHGLDYVREKFITVETEAISGFGAGCMAHTARGGYGHLLLGSYDTITSDPADTRNGRVWSFTPDHREDCFITSRSEAADTANELLGTTGRLFLPQNPPPMLGVLGGAYSLSNVVTTIRVSFLASGTLGAGSIPLLIEDIGNGTRGTCLTNVGAAYAGAPFAVAHAAYNSGFTLALTMPQTAVKGRELWIHVHRGRKVVETFSSDLPDVQQGLPHTPFGLHVAKNFSAYLETSGIRLGNQDMDAEIEGIWVYTKVTGNRADTATAGEGIAVGQNQYRFMMDVAFHTEVFSGWKHVALVDCNAARRPHISQSKAEIAVNWIDRPNLQHLLSTDGTEANGMPMARNEDVNVEFIPMRAGTICKTLWLRFGRDTAVSQDHGAANKDHGIREGNFKLVGFRIVGKLVPADRSVHSSGSTTRGSD